MANPTDVQQKALIGGNCRISNATAEIAMRKVDPETARFQVGSPDNVRKRGGGEEIIEEKRIIFYPEGSTSCRACNDEKYSTRFHHKSMCCCCESERGSMKSIVSWFAIKPAFVQLHEPATNRLSMMATL